MAMLWLIAAFALNGFAAETVDIGGVAVPAESALARGEHPRLLFTLDDVPRLRERVQSGILKDIEPGAKVMGTPAKPLKQFFREVAILGRLAKKEKKS